MCSPKIFRNRGVSRTASENLAVYDTFNFCKKKSLTLCHMEKSFRSSLLSHQQRSQAQLATGTQTTHRSATQIDLSRGSQSRASVACGLSGVRSRIVAFARQTRAYFPIVGGFLPNHDTNCHPRPTLAAAQRDLSHVCLCPDHRINAHRRQAISVRSLGSTSEPRPHKRRRLPSIRMNT